MQCSHPPCTCTVTYEGDFCSDACRNVKAAEMLCPCDHAECFANQPTHAPQELGNAPLREGVLPPDLPPPPM